MKKKLISAIIPCYNEEKIIESSVNAVEKALSSMDGDFELVIVDDGSTDGTKKILERLVKSGKHLNLRFLSYANGPSRRENLAKSFKSLKGGYILLLDMDLSLDLKHLKEMIGFLDRGFDLVIPNRYHKASKIRRDPKRYAISKLYNALIRALFMTGLKDNICGFKAFRRDAAMKLVAQAGIDKSGKRSVFWDTELLIRAIKNGMKIKQIPVHWEESDSSTLTFKREMKMFPYIMKFWMGFRSGRIK